MGFFAVVEVEGAVQIVDSGGTERGTVSLPFRVDPTGTTTQPMVVTPNGYGGRVEGRAADGAAPVGYPVLVGGYDGENVRRLRTLSDGTLKVYTTPGAQKGAVIDKVKNGGSENMAVDGSSTPVNFRFLADPSVDLLLRELRFVFVPNVLRVDGSSFGAFGALTNGVRVAITDGGIEYVLGLLKRSEDIFAFSTIGGLTLEVSLSANDLVVFGLNLGEGYTLHAGTSDKVEVRIQDNLTSQGSKYLRYFTGTVYAVKEIP